MPLTIVAYNCQLAYDKILKTAKSAAEAAVAAADAESCHFMVICKELPLDWFPSQGVWTVKTIKPSDLWLWKNICIGKIVKEKSQNIIGNTCVSGAKVRGKREIV